MPRQSRRTRSQRQAEKIANTTNSRYKRKLASIRREAKKSQEKILKTALKNVKGKGIYEPKSTKLTKYRKYRIRKVIKSYGDLIDPRRFFFIPAPKEKQKEILERSTSLRIKTTKKGLFLEKQGFKTASLKEDKTRGELYIKRTGKTKRGPRAGKRYTSITPLASVDELDKERDRIRRLGEELQVRGNERLAFKIVENGNEGYSHATFDNIELLINYLDRYQKKTPARVQFYRHIEIEKVKTSATWFEMHPRNTSSQRTRRRRQNRGGRTH